MTFSKLTKKCQERFNAFNVYCRELAPGTVSLTGDRAQGDDSKHCAYSTLVSFCLVVLLLYVPSQQLWSRPGGQLFPGQA